MARLPILILLLGVLTTSVSSSELEQGQDTEDLETIVPSENNENGLFIRKMSLNDGAQEEYKIDMRRSINKRQVSPPGYQIYPGIGYYKFYPEGAMSYYQALSTCKNDGGHLAIINSKTEMAILKHMYADHSGAKGFAWLGFNDIAIEGRYETLFGLLLGNTGYADWQKNQPDAISKGEDCGAMDRGGKLHDLYCEKDAPWPFFCEIELQ